MRKIDLAACLYPLGGCEHASGLNAATGLFQPLPYCVVRQDVLRPTCKVSGRDDGKAALNSTNLLPYSTIPLTKANSTGNLVYHLSASSHEGNNLLLAYQSSSVSVADASEATNGLTAACWKSSKTCLRRASLNLAKQSLPRR